MNARIFHADDLLVRDIEHARELLAADSPPGTDGMPCSRYGRHLRDAYDVVYWAAVALNAAASGDPVSWADLDYMAGLVVNHHPDPAYLLVNYGHELPADIDVNDLIDVADFAD